MRGPSPRRLWKYSTGVLRLKNFFLSPGDRRPRPQISARVLDWALLLGRIPRQGSFHSPEALAGSAVRGALGLATSFREDALAYFTERLEAHATHRPQLGNALCRLRGGGRGVCHGPLSAHHGAVAPEGGGAARGQSARVAGRGPETLPVPTTQLLLSIGPAPGGSLGRRGLRSSGKPTLDDRPGPALRQVKPSGEVIEAYWVTHFSARRVGSRTLYRIAKSR